ncbi:hypothetical protein ACJX0J_039905, partial [Zea mays]
NGRDLTPWLKLMPFSMWGWIWSGLVWRRSQGGKKLVSGKLKGNTHAYHLALKAIAWKEDWKMAELLLHEMVADSDCALDARAFNGLIYVCAKRRLDAWATKENSKHGKLAELAMEKVLEAQGT